MIDHRDTNVVRIPIDQITVMNPRERGKMEPAHAQSTRSGFGSRLPLSATSRATPYA